MTLEALRWLHDIGAAFVQIGADGEAIVASGPSGLDDARLRRAQALAASNGVGLAIVRELLQTKLEGQFEVLEQLPSAAVAREIVAQLKGELEHATSEKRLRYLEARAAAAYWEAWAPVGIQLGRKDRNAIPDHWQSFATRTSVSRMA